MDHEQFRYSDDEAKAIVSVFAWMSMDAAPSLSELEENAVLRGVAHKALDAWKLATVRSVEAATASSAKDGAGAAFDAALCCGAAEFFAACFKGATRLAQKAETALRAAESVESGCAKSPCAVLGGIAAICEWGRTVESILHGGVKDAGRRWDDLASDCATPAADCLGAMAMADALREETALFDAPHPFSPFHGTFPTRVAPGPAIEIPAQVRSRIRDPRFLVLESSNEGVAAVTLLGFEPMVLRSARPGADSGRWAGALSDGRLELAAAPLSRLGADGSLPLPAGGAVSEGDEIMLMGDGPALSGFDSGFCRASFSAFAEELAEADEAAR